MKRQSDWMDRKKKKRDSTICCLQETRFSFKDTQAESEGRYSMQMETKGAEVANMYQTNRL